MDNLKFCSGADERDKLKKAVMVYIRRCVEANSTLNDVPCEVIGDAKKLEEWIDSNISPVVEFLGVKLDHRNKTVCLASKTVKKAERVVDTIQCKITSRQFSAVMSLLLYTHQVLQFPIACYQEALQMWRQVHMDRQLDDQWDRLVLVHDDVKAQIADWAKSAATNRPRPVPREKEAPKAWLITDASAIGWSGILVIPATGEIKHASGRWPERVQFSSKAEPIAVLMATMALVPPNYSGTICLCSDNSGTVFSFIRGFATSTTLNAVVDAVQQYVPGAKLDARHIPGVSNPADEESRGNPLDLQKLYAFLTDVLCEPRMEWKTPVEGYGYASAPEMGRTDLMTAVNVVTPIVVPSPVDLL